MTIVISVVPILPFSNRSAVPALPRASILRAISRMDQSNGDWWRYGIFYQVYPRSFQDSMAMGSAISGV